jgi:hypothetical protein
LNNYSFPFWKHVLARTPPLRHYYDHPFYGQYHERVAKDRLKDLEDSGMSIPKYARSVQDREMVISEVGKEKLGD